MQAVLGSWKEIANYLGKGVRTVQRWERYSALPVHRPSGSSKGVVIAFTEELDQWARRQDGTRHVDAARLNVSRNKALSAALATQTRQLQDRTLELIKSCAYIVELSQRRRAETGRNGEVPSSPQKAG
jgi:hypothetical protein